MKERRRPMGWRWLMAACLPLLISFFLLYRIYLLSSEVDAYGSRREEIPSIRSEIENSRSEIEGLQRSLDGAPAVTFQSPSRNRSVREGGGNLLDSNNLANAEYRAAMLQFLSSDVARAYAVLFTRLGLSPEEFTKFNELLTVLFTAPVHTPNSSVITQNEESRVADPARSNLIQRVNADIKALLGPERFAAFENYQFSREHQGVVDEIRLESELAGSALTNDQAYDLQYHLALLRLRMDSQTAELPIRAKEQLGEFLTESQVRLVEQALSRREAQRSILAMRASLRQPRR